MRGRGVLARGRGVFRSGAGAISPLAAPAAGRGVRGRGVFARGRGGFSPGAAAPLPGAAAPWPGAAAPWPGAAAPWPGAGTPSPDAGFPSPGCGVISSLTARALGPRASGPRASGQGGRGQGGRLTARIRTAHPLPSANRPPQPLSPGNPISAPHHRAWSLTKTRSPARIQHSPWPSAPGRAPSGPRRMLPEPAAPRGQSSARQPLTPLNYPFRLRRSQPSAPAKDILPRGSHAPCSRCRFRGPRRLQIAGSWADADRAACVPPRAGQGCAYRR